MIPLNQQPREPQQRSGDKSRLEIVHVWRTIQGEGPYVGMPSVFIRFAGCNLQCRLCDTDYTSNRRWVEVYDLVNMVRELSRDGLVVLTGGEPFRQNLHLLVERLLQLGYGIQIETNGTFCPKWLQKFPHEHKAEQLLIVCSPKLTYINAQLRRFIGAYKYVLEASSVDPDDGLPTSVLGTELRVARPSGGAPIYLQPVEDPDPAVTKRNTEAVVASALKFNYIVSLQTHKILGLP